MAYQGFGKSSGPSAAPQSQAPLPNFPRAPSPSPPLYGFPRQPSPRILEAPDPMSRPPFLLESNHSVSRPSFPSPRAAYRPIESPPAWGDGQKSFLNMQSQQRPPAVASFAASRNSRASVPTGSTSFYELDRTSFPPLLPTDNHISRNPRVSSGRPIESPPAWGDGQTSVLSTQSQQRPPALASFAASRNSRASVPTGVAPFHELDRTSFPPLLPTDNRISRDPRVSIGRPTLSSAWNNQQKLPGSFANSQPLGDHFSVSPYIGTYNSENSFPTKRADSQVTKRTRSPPSLSENEVSQENSNTAVDNSKRISASPSKLSTRSNVLFTAPTLRIHEEPVLSARSNDAEAAAIKATSFPVPKRTRSPPVSYDDDFLLGNHDSAQDDSERELQAKAKRLARFKDELSQPVQRTTSVATQKSSASRFDQPMVERPKFMGEQSEDFPNVNVLSDVEATDSSSRIISGLCQDMCPESERAERERKGDLDLYERLDGDRNQTTKSLAVKKYTRTAEREAVLIRPMPILQRTIDYLLNLLDQPYDDRFLGLYNFLWDRMRAIRMDLRMQHIFNLDAITMLEQMIRLHIIAMHELCEYTKGEGFSEGFDAHLNIEQMNKTSVELFQLYDDHRKKGIRVLTEKEFRGYYALLKLDKHPGYKVEPAELSLDLSKMTPEIRQTSEVLFARDVARACRTGNFIAFFRLARKATYLQACLMHAHFAKLRTQALASLHCGLQNNQGIPVAQVAKWLGLEEEDIENLLEYHGFLVKEFEEPYMVKDGSFLNSDTDYPVKGSELVHLKKSRNIVKDVISPCLAMSSSADEAEDLQTGTVHEQEAKPSSFAKTETSIRAAVDEEMSDSIGVSHPIESMLVKPMPETVAVVQQSETRGQMMASTSPFSLEYTFPNNLPQSQPPKVGSFGKPKYDALFRNSLERNVHSDTEPALLPSASIPTKVEQEGLAVFHADSAKKSLVPQPLFVENLEDDLHSEDEQKISTDQNTEDDEVDMNYYDREAAEAKLKLILRIWKRRTSKKREIREQRQLAANAARDFLSLGPLIGNKKHEASTTCGDFDMDGAMRERYDKYVQSWSRLNVSDVVAGKLGARNPNAKCLCWKVILYSQMEWPNRENSGHFDQAADFTLGTWLLSKIIPTKKNDEMVVSSPDLSIWKKWVPSQSGGDPTCCLSVIRDAKVDNVSESTTSGASAVIFLVSENIPWELQKTRLHNLITFLPSGSCLPLLILTGSNKSALTEMLGLRNIDKSRITNYMVASFDEFASDGQLRDGLEWLASLSPPQPVLSCVRTRELVLTHLGSLLEGLDEMGAYEVGPHHCITVFNNTLDQTLGEVTAAADANGAHWPCPEIALLEGPSDEVRAVELYLPDIGWSSGSRIRPLTSTIRECKLPNFTDDISWIYRGSSSGMEIKNQSQQLQDCLIRYMAQASKVMGLALATKEASVMLQNCARLELHNSTYYIIPNWVMIFRRIFNWRLMNLSSGGQLTAAYVLNISNSKRLDTLGFENMSYSPYYVTHPSLDEMVEVGCSAIMSPGQTTENPNANAIEIQMSNDDAEFEQEDGKLVDIYTVDKLNRSGELAVVTTPKATKEADKLSKLLEQCNIVQNMIDKKLSIYF